MSRGHREPRYAPGMHSPDASSRGRKRRFEGGLRNAEGPKRRRMEGEAGEKTDHVLAPIGYKALEGICREEVAENAILKLTKKARQFEALLCMEEIRPDLVKLVISSFRLLCSSNNIMTANAEKILRTPIAKKFITGTVLSKFINEMEYSSDTLGFDTVINDLTVIFLALIQKFGESIVYSLPLPQLSASLVALKEKNLIERADDLEKKLQHVKELKTDVIRRAKSAHDQESQREPPQNFREISVIPEAADLLCSRPFLRENITDRKFKELDHYLDVQFRLLREDFVMPLREGIRQLRKESISLEPTTASSTRRGNDVSVYHDVTVLYPVCSRKGKVYKIRFDQSRSEVKRVKWERSKRLKFGSLICLSSDEFNTFVFATVENRNADELIVGELEVRFENVEIAEINRFIQDKKIFVMIESSAYFEAYRHVLEALKEINPEEFPFQQHIVECCPDIRPPEYQLQVKEAKEDKDAFSFNFAGILAKNKSVQVRFGDYHSPSASSQATIAHAKDSIPQENKSAGTCTDSLNNSDVAMDNEMPHEIFNWPDRESLGFNESQMRAFKLALTKQFAVIQGPPGTGKTFVGLKIAQALLENASLWQNGTRRSPILMVSYTNHALDQFLEGLIPMLPFGRGIVRVGGRSKSQKLEGCNLKSLKVKARSSVAPARRAAQYDIRMQRRSYQRSSLLIRATRSSIISLDVLKQYGILRRHYQQFSFQARRRSINEELLKWLEIERNDKSENNRAKDDQQRDDFQKQVATSGYSFDNNDVRDDNVALREIAALTINDAKNPNYVRRNFNNASAMSEGEEKSVELITRLNRRDRWRLYRLWTQRLEKHQQKLLQSCQGEFEEALSRDKELDTMVEYGILQKASVIGMTTTCAAKYRHILQRICPQIVLVEEAAEVLEAHLITSLTKGCQHLILIGDHQQLRPTPAVYELAKKYKLDVSLFERMVNVGIPCERLSVQHRMRPEIAALMQHIYKDLENHESVENYEDIKGMKKNMFFVNHSHLENHNDESHSHTNQHEAKFLVALCRYLFQQGYSAEQITLLTTYTGQMFAIRDCLKEENDEKLKGIRLTTVDNFQGEENDIILLSLVRSNKNEKVGFVKVVNRACVALSRAKKGFYCIGNFDLLSKHSDIWSKIVADLKASASIGNALPLVCQIHHEDVTVKAAEDFMEKVPDGGCLRRCEVRLPCGHVCKFLCHPKDLEHEEYLCKEDCPNTIKGCSHLCPKLCYQKCETDCPEHVEKTLPSCGHTERVRCGMDVYRVQCKKRCEKILSKCGHRCQERCCTACTTKCKELVKRSDWPCGHLATIACSATPADCSVSCRATLECDHRCEGKCGECRMGRLHKRCRLRCGRLLVCSHPCEMSCTTSCPPCSSDCENRCVHSHCSKTCGEPCVPCAEKCVWLCPHYECTKPCGQLCNRPRCDEPCKKILRCGRKYYYPHSCRGLCGEPCICAVCERNDGRDPITEIFLGGEDEEDAVFIQLPDCKHIFAVSDLDRYMDISNDDSTDDHVIQLKSCPRCKTAIRRSLRYGNVIKQQLQNIEEVKKKVHGDASEIKEAKDRLEVRLTVLKKQFDGDNEMKEWKKLERSVSRMSKGIMTAVTENQVTLMERHCLMNQKLKRSLLNDVARRKASIESCLEVSFIQEELDYLKKRSMSERVTQRELRDVNLEFTRLNLQLELCLLNHDVTSLNLTLDEPSTHVMRNVRDNLSSGKLMEAKRLDELLEKLAAIREAYPAFGPLTPEEKKQIVSAVGLKQGHWYKCPKGHIYAIGECGGAMQKSTCPECGAAIGGASHRLEEGNELAPEMDGARHAAWSEQANLQNYVIVDEA